MRRVETRAAHAFEQGVLLVVCTLLLLLPLLFWSSPTLSLSFSLKQTIELARLLIAFSGLRRIEWTRKRRKIAGE